VSTSARIVASVGGSLQVVGVALVFWEIWGIQRLLNKRTWTREIADALAAPFRRLARGVRARGRRQASTVELRASVPATGTLNARLTINETPNATVEQRIEIHRQRLDQIDKQLEEKGRARARDTPTCPRGCRYLQRLMNSTVAVLTSSGFEALRKCRPPSTTRSSAPGLLRKSFISSSALATE